MADYIYLLESRLSPAQQKAIQAVREIARTKALTVFLVGGAVRDLTSGSPVRDLDVAVQGNALKLKKEIEKAGGVITGENEAGLSLFVRFPGNVRMEVGSTLTAHYPKPGKPVYKAAMILDDLRRRDFTANAMALSLNEGSYGLLMDPLNGVADIENRELRLVSNYGFIEDPVRMIRAARFSARLGWQMEEKTRARYETGKSEGYISTLSPFLRGYEVEEIVHEEDPLRVLRGLESEGWMKVMYPAWSASKANVGELEKLREAQMQLQMRGIATDASAAQFPLLTAKMQSKDIAGLKKIFPRQGFVKEIEALENEGKKFAAEFASKQAATASAAWKMLHTASPEAVLWTAYSTKNAGLQGKLKSFYNEWPQARQKVPYTMMQEMRIIPTLGGYGELVEKIVFELMDGKLTTPEEMKAYLEPHSPPAPPPPVHLRRARATRKEIKPAKARKSKPVADKAAGEVAAASVGVQAAVTPAAIPVGGKQAAGAKTSPVAKPVAVAVKSAAATKTPTAAKAVAIKAAPAKAAKSTKQASKTAPAKAGKGKATSTKTASRPAAKKAAPVKAGARKAAPAASRKAVAKKVAGKTAPARKAVKGKPLAKATAKPSKSAVKKSGAKAAAKKTAPKPAAKKPAAKKPAAKKPAAKKPAAKKPVRAASKVSSKKKKR
jgi:tRNA nucleotidyltransferase (CCA-adding enzyme)